MHSSRKCCCAGMLCVMCGMSRSDILSVRTFSTDSSFHEWAAKHPEGWVLNVRRRLSPDYVVLHRTTCPSLLGQSYAPGALTERSYGKVGGGSEEELIKWLKTHIPAAPGFTKRCTRCSA